MSTEVRRSSELIQSEMSDLARYLEGLPAELRASGALRSYEARLSQLENELLVASVAELIQQTNPAKKVEFLSLSREPEIVLDSLDRELGKAQESVKGHLRRTRIIHHILDFGSMWVIIGVLVFANGAELWMSIAAVLVTINAMYGAVDRAVEKQLLLGRFTSARKGLKALRLGNVEASSRARILTTLLTESSPGVEGNHIAQGHSI
jgi:hypothetical protein